MHPHPEAASPRSTPSRLAAGGAAVLLVLTIAWPALAFGGVYPWAYLTLFLLCVVFALLAVSAAGGRIDRVLLACTLAVLAAVALQLVPLPVGVLRRASPAALEFLRGHNLAYALVSATAAMPHALSIEPAATWRFAGFFAALALLLLGVVSLGTVRSLAFVVTTVTAIGAALALIGIVQAGAGTARMYGIWAPQTATAVFGPFVNRNHFAGWMLAALPVAMAQCAAYVRVARRQAGDGARLVEQFGTPGAAQALVVALAVLVMSAALLLTRSRSGLGGFFVVTTAMMVVYAWQRRSARDAALALALVVTLVGGAIAWTGWSGIVTRFDELPGSRLSGRLDAWREGARIASDFWLTGSGLNTYASTMLAYHDPAVQLYFRTPHNDYLQALTDGGLLVGIPLAALLGVIAWRIVRAVRSPVRRPSFDAWTRTGAAVGLSAVALQEFVDFSLQTPATAVVVTVLAGYALSGSPLWQRPSAGRRR